MKDLRARFGNIRQIVDVGDGLVILESLSGYPKDQINLYKVDYDFKPLWNAEYRTYGYGIDYYANPISEDENGNLVCAGAIGDTYTIDPKSGKILKAVYTK